MHDRADDIVLVANELVGMAYRHQGRGERGIDCVGVPIYIAHRLELSNWDTKDYGPRPALHVFNKMIVATGATRIPMPELSRDRCRRVLESGSSSVCCIAARVAGRRKRFATADFGRRTGGGR